MRETTGPVILGTEPGQLNIKVEIDQTLQLDSQYLAVPAGIKRKLVIRDHIGSSLSLA